uniref:Uncharacterized protein n=2 Tax=Caenorhabditis tropicalis TaxID=1561998 RepID=A0A1I7UV45_9PELO
MMTLGGDIKGLWIKDFQILSKMQFLLQAIFTFLFLFFIVQAEIYSSYPSWHYDPYGNLAIGNRDNGFYPGTCFGPTCPWGK